MPLTDETIAGLRLSNRLDETAARVLNTAAEFVHRGWTQTVDARDRHGDKCAPHHPEAACWCAQGAIRAASFKLALTYVNYYGVLVYADPETSGNVQGRASHAFAVGAMGGDIHTLNAAAKGLVADVTTWNDKDERTQDEVIEAFRRGAEVLRERVRVVTESIERLEANRAQS